MESTIQFYNLYRLTIDGTLTESWRVSFFNEGPFQWWTIWGGSVMKEFTDDMDSLLLNFV
jgi:hypothetical protein